MLKIFHNIILLKYISVSICWYVLKYLSFFLHFQFCFLYIFIRHEIFFIKPCQAERYSCISFLNILFSCNKISKIPWFSNAEYFQICSIKLNKYSFHQINKCFSTIYKWYTKINTWVIRHLLFASNSIISFVLNMKDQFFRIILDIFGNSSQILNRYNSF